MILRVRRLNASAFGTTAKSPLTIVKSPASIAASVPVPIAIPRSAATKAAASFTPSPTIATLAPLACNSPTMRNLSAGNTPLRVSLTSIPTCLAMSCTGPIASPETIMGRTPSSRSSATIDAAVGLIWSLTSKRATTSPSTVASTIVATEFP